MDYAVLYNPVAGRGRALRIAEEAQAFLRSKGHRVVEARSKRPGHVEELAREHGDVVDRILVLGGDGSLREAAAGLIGRDGRRRGSPAALGVLPMGSGNVVARELGLPLDPLAALAELETASVRTFDVGVARAGGEPELFLAMCGVGFDAEVAGAVDRARKTALGGRVYRRSGDLVYGAVGLGKLLLGARVPLEVELDGAPLEGRVSALVVCNARIYGKGMVLTPEARPDDGELDVHLQRSRSPLGMATTLLSAQARRRIPGWAGKAARARTLRIAVAGSRPVQWQLDGDPIGEAHELEVELVPGAVRLLGPLGEAPPRAVGGPPAERAVRDTGPLRAGGL